VLKIKFVGEVVFEKKRFEAIVDGNTYAYERPWHKDRRRNSSVLKMISACVCVQNCRSNVSQLIFESLKALEIHVK
jgi:hypothetical protein